MNRTQRLLVLICSCAVAVVLLLGAGPFTEIAVTVRGFGPKYPWNPLAGTIRMNPDPVLGLIVPLALVGFGLFVWFGRPKGKAPPDA